MDFTETTTWQDREQGVRRFMARGQCTRCEVTMKWEEEVAFMGIPQWKVVEGVSDQLVGRELDMLSSAMRSGAVVRPC